MKVSTNMERGTVDFSFHNEKKEFLQKKTFYHASIYMFDL